MRTGLFALAMVCAGPSPALAQQDMSKVDVKVERLAPGVAVLFGAGGNIGLSYGEDGNVLIDDQYAPLTDRIVAAAASVDPDPIRFVINTHWHFDHTGGNENLGKRGAVVVAHDNVRKRMEAGQVLVFASGRREDVPAAPRGALPLVTFDDGVTLHLNGDTLRVVHVSHAHTDGDALVRWEKANVLHMGDTFFHKVTFPFIDLSSGGSIDGLIAAVGRGLELADETTRIIPGHGPAATRSDLAAYLEMLKTVRAEVAAGIAARRSLDQIRAAAPAARYGMADGFVKPDEFVGSVYNSLKQPPNAHDDGAKPHAH